MTSSNGPTKCYFLTRLPSELRITIYELLLSFKAPLKLRQLVAGSDRTNILRTCRQIHHEALSVLFDINTVSATRNDFCINTDPRLKTPIAGKHIRSLLISSFGESIACNFLPEPCNVCSDGARGFFQALAAMPNLKTVTADYSMNPWAFRRMYDYADELPTGIHIRCESVGVYRVRGLAFDSVDFTFRHLPLSKIWPVLAELSSSQPSEVEESKTMERLREVDADLPDKVWLLFRARGFNHLDPFSMSLFGDIWLEDRDVTALDELKRSAALDERERSAALHRLTTEVQAFLGRQTAVQARRSLRRFMELSTV